MKHFKKAVILAIVLILIFAIGESAYFIFKRFEENRILREVVERLSADSRIAEVLVTRSGYNETSNKIETTIKFLEYDAQSKPLSPRYFTFHGNLIQFQALVIRFEDKLIRAGDRLRGKSAYLFLRAFMLDGRDTQVFNLTEMNQIPQGYKILGIQSDWERKLWEEFWDYALSPKARTRTGIKNAQIEAPGSLFLPGMIYTLKIEHDGGIWIDAKPLPEILKGEGI